MKIVTLENIDLLPASLFDKNDIEKLVIRNSRIALPEGIATQKQLKELHLVGCTVESMPQGLLELDTLFFFENNQPANIQLAACILFDHQRKKITKDLAGFYLQLLKKQFEEQRSIPIEWPLQALDHKLQGLRKAAMDWFHHAITPPDSIPEGSVFCIQGKPSAFTISDISARLSNLKLKLQDKMGPSVTHIILAEEPQWKDKLPVDKILLTEIQFFQWLNKADELYLSAQTEENKEARQNIAAMLHSNDPANAALALQMMKTNGVSKDLLTDLFVFYHVTTETGLKRKAKTLFKQFAPAEVISFLESHSSRLLGSLETFTDVGEFIGWAESTGYLDVVKIALLKNEIKPYIESGSEETVQKLITQLIQGDSLDLSKTNGAALPEGMLDKLPIKKINCKGPVAGFLSHPVLTSLEQIEVLNLDTFHYRHRGMPENMGNLKNLKHLVLGILENFPAGVLSIPNLEIIEMKLVQGTQMPDDAKWPDTLRSLVLHHPYWEKVEDVTMEKLKKILPLGCTVTFEITEK